MKTKDFIFGAVDPEEARYIRAPKLSPVVKHADHDQSSHGRKGSGRSVTGEEMNKTLEDVALSEYGMYAGELESKAGLVKRSVTENLTSRLSDVSTEDLVVASGVEQQILGKAKLQDVDILNEDGSIDKSRVFIKYESAADSYTGEARYVIQVVGKDAVVGQHPTDFGYVSIEGEAGEALLRECSVSSLIQAWAYSSNDNPQSLALQDAVKKRFGLEDVAGEDVLSELGIAVIGKKDALMRDYGHVFTRFAEEQYSSTQEWFKARGISEVELYRGLQSVSASTEVAGALSQRQIGVAGAFRARPLSSWSPSAYWANNFTDVPDAGTVSGVIKTTVPVSKIFATPFTGIGCLNEKEIVVLGGLLPITVANYKTHWADRS